MIRFWSDYNPIINRSIIRFQSLWRGYSVRYLLKLAGKGALSRGICHNDDEMVTSESKEDVHPFDYFSIEEEGKIWWFDQKTMIEWSQTQFHIKNPYTRKELSSSDSCRLRNLCYIRRKKKLDITHSNPKKNPGIEYLRDQRWLRVVQIIKECNFEFDIHPNHMIGMEYVDLQIFMNSILEDTRAWMYDSVGSVDPSLLRSKRYKLFLLIRSMRNTMHTYRETDHLSHDIAGVLLSGLNDIRDPTDFVFFILSAGTRSGALAAGL
jgi:hypothetical protein